MRHASIARHFSSAIPDATLWLSDSNRRYSTLPGATQHYPTLPDTTRRYPTLPDATRRHPTLCYPTLPELSSSYYPTLPDATRRDGTLLGATRNYPTLRATRCDASRLHSKRTLCAALMMIERLLCAALMVERTMCALCRSNDNNIVIY
jgi:hypothetical protein